MYATLCPVQRSTIVQVTRPPLSLWRYHWHELFPLARAEDGNGRAPLFMSEVETGEGRRALCSRLRELLADLPPPNGSPVVVDGYLVQVLEDSAGLLPDVDTHLDALLEKLSPNGNS